MTSFLPLPTHFPYATKLFKSIFIPIPLLLISLKLLWIKISYQPAKTDLVSIIQWPPQSSIRLEFCFSRKTVQFTWFSNVLANNYLLHGSIIFLMFPTSVESGFVFNFYSSFIFPFFQRISILLLISFISFCPSIFLFVCFAFSGLTLLFFFYLFECET